MRFSMKKRIISVILISIIMISYVVVAQGTTTDDLNAANNQKKETQSKIAETQAKIDKLAKEKTSTESYIKQLDQQLAEIDRQIYDLNIKIADKEVQIAENEALLAQAQTNSEEQYASMKLRIQYMYEHESESYLTVLLASKDIGDMLNKAEYINKITSYDREMLTQYANTLKLIQETQVILHDDYIELEESRAYVEEDRTSLSMVVRAKESEVNNLNAKSAEAAAYKAELDKALKADDALIASIQEKIAKEEAAGSTTLPTYDGGKMVWPVPASKKINTYFGEMDATIWGSTPHNGLDIAPVTRGVAGDKIVAAYDGIVTIATLSSTAGNYVQIYHGNGLYTRYLHNSAVLVSAGQKVTKGQTIALMGNTGYSTGVHLHFDIMLNGKYQDPMKYVSNK